MRAVRFTVVLSALGLLAACATSPSVKQQRQKELQSAVEQFHRSMQWEMIDKATKYVAASFEENFRGRYEEYGDDLDIVGLKIERVQMGEARRGATTESTNATVEVKQRWYVEPDMSVNEEVYVEVWKFGDSGWKIHDRLPREQWRDRQRTDESTHDSPPDADDSDAHSPDG